ncbi:hypothetical protein Q4489_05725 [Thalassotalea sp. 1_MG-2023]|uniref:hypothetical protein n=1 Tax=Thalassotalea sp. 1_MG-2023 TaxID=3062680 RepID=UPI0026E162E6|nr:hypothetical protein [Thalassotalea sp. 1_MG-2023]MDO6426502.1 hypothetical protein [Thalassotalea sp. 1_MG-2023]
MLNLKKSSKKQHGKATWLNRFTKQELLFVWLVLIIFILFDLFTRINTSSDDINNVWSQQSLSTTPLLLLDNVHLNELANKLDKFEQSEKPGVEKQQGLTEAERIAQQGDLNELYAKNMRLTLVGVFNQGGRFAVIAQENLTTSKRELLRVSLSDTIDGYTVQNILPNKLVLTGYNNEINLHLYNTNS